MKALLLLLLLGEIGGLGWFWRCQVDRDQARIAAQAPGGQTGDQTRSDQPQPATDDYRYRVYTACTLVFLCFTVFLLGSHQRDRKARDELDQLQRRIADLEARGRR